MRFLISLATVLILFTLQGCAPVEITNNNVTNGNANTFGNASNASNVQPAKEPAGMMPVTLPVLDAMLADTNFIKELKMKLQLTDEETDQLKRIAGEGVANLSETEDGSTRESSRLAEERIRGVLGADRTAKLLTMVRTRWSEGGEEALLPTEPNSIPNDTRVVVNAPAYRMDLFQNGKLVKTYKVGIGYPEFPLPTGVRKASEIIFNPTWTPPDEPWVKGEYQPGKTVEAGSKQNPLGLIKIPIGLPSLIHGGKNPARLGTFASHGCVGLTNPQIQDFAVQLAGLSGMQLTRADVANYAKERGETENVKLQTPVPVELRYETIIVEDGKLRIFRDVYEYGTNTEENLRRVLTAFGVSLDNLDPNKRGDILNALQQMSVDALGKPVETSENRQPANSNRKSENNGNSDSGKVTRNIKGKKEIVIDLPDLKGKGYPAPVNLSS